MHCMCMQRQRTRRQGFSPRGQPVRRRTAHHAVPRRRAAAGSPVCYGYPVYFGIPGGPMHPGAPCKAPHAGPPGSGEPGVLRTSGILKVRAATPAGPKAPRPPTGSQHTGFPLGPQIKLAPADTSNLGRCFRAGNLASGPDFCKCVPGENPAEIRAGETFKDPAGHG